MMTVELIESHDLEVLIPLLHDAEEGDDRIVRAIEDPGCAAYLALDGAEPVGAAVVRWAQDESELLYIAVREQVRGRGYGKLMVRGVLEEARRRGVRAILVGTANTGLDNIMFYQKCGFRMDAVRKDFFDYFPEPLYDNGIQMRDMLVLRYEFEASSPRN